MCASCPWSLWQDGSFSSKGFPCFHAPQRGGDQGAVLRVASLPIAALSNFQKFDLVDEV